MYMYSQHDHIHVQLDAYQAGCRLERDEACDEACDERCGGRVMCVVMVGLRSVWALRGGLKGLNGHMAGTGLRQWRQGSC